MYQKPSIVVAAAVVLVAACFVDVLDARALKEAPKKASVLDALRCEGTFGTLKAAVAEAGLGDALTDPDASITLFAPSNKAFEKYFAETGLTAGDLLASDKLADILKYHVVPAKIKAADIDEGDSAVASLLGPELAVNFDGCCTVKLNDDAMVTYPDIVTENGIVHIIDSILVPPETSDDTEKQAETVEVEDPPEEEEPVEDTEEKDVTDEFADEEPMTGPVLGK